MKLSVIGLGKLGLPFSFFLASNGYKVMCYDKNRKLINTIVNKNSPYPEPGLKKYINKYYKMVTITNNIEDLILKTNITFLVLPTPSKKDGSFSNKYILEVLDTIGKTLFLKKSKSHLINITSTVSPNSCEKIFIPFLKKKYKLVHGKDYSIIYNPHFIAQGTTLENLKKPNILLLGTNNKTSKTQIGKIYNKIYKKKYIFSYLNLLEAEIAKLSLNTFVTNKISFSNYISEICESSRNADAVNVLKTIGKDTRIGTQYMNVGTKYSGPCFPRDNKALSTYAKKIKISQKLLNTTDSINKRQTNRLIKIIIQLKKHKKKRFNIGILGMTYKKDTNIVKNSQGLDLLNNIIKKNSIYKKIFIFDKYVKNLQLPSKTKRVHICKKMLDVANNSDIIFIMYKDNYFLKINKAKVKKNKVIIDCWRFINSVKSPYKFYLYGKSISYNLKNIIN